MMVHHLINSAAPRLVPRYAATLTSCPFLIGNNVSHGEDASIPRVTSTQKRSINSSALTIERTQDKSRFANRPKKEELQFGKVMSDHMLMVEWNQSDRWGDPKIIPYQDLKISPVASCLNYGITCFEGMKAYKAIPDQSLRLFRPDLNMQRLQRSMDRLSMIPTNSSSSSKDLLFDSSELINCMKELIKLDQDWIPYGEGYSLYIRPNVIATHPFLGLAAPDSLLLYVVTSPVGPYYKTGFQPIRLKSEQRYVRAWPGGTGDAKVGGNYAPTMKPAREAAEKGYGQVLWLLDGEITEVGAMNVFFVLSDESGNERELVTPPLSRGDILPGVTRRSIVELAQSWNKDGGIDTGEGFPPLHVSERNITMQEVHDAAKEGRLVEAFGAGTAAVVTPICCIEHEGEDIDIPATGEVTQRVWDELTSIQYGKMEHPDGWSVRID